MIRAEDLKKTNWQCIHFAPESNVNAALGDLTNTEFAMFRVNVKDVESEQELFARIASEMRFPDYFGSNWDAFDECLRDLEWLPSKGYVLILDNSTSFWRSSPQVGGKLIESWLFVAQEWALEQTPFHLVFVL